MIRVQRETHARVWALLALVLVAAAVVSVVVRRHEAFNRDGLPGVNGGGAGAAPIQSGAAPGDAPRGAQASAAGSAP